MTHRYKYLLFLISSPLSDTHRQALLSSSDSLMVPLLVLMCLACFESFTANEILPLQIKIAPLCEGFKLFFSDPCVWGRALNSRFIAKLRWFIKGPAVFHLFRDQKHHNKLKSRKKKESSSPQNNNQNHESRT